MEPLSYYRQALHDRGLDPSPVDRRVAAVASADAGARAAQLAQLAHEADLLPYILDRDYGAIALQHAARSLADADLRRHLLSAALARATRCASGATSGGEGLARSSHVRELEALLAAPTDAHASPPEHP